MQSLPNAKQGFSIYLVVGLLRGGFRDRRLGHALHQSLLHLLVFAREQTVGRQWLPMNQPSTSGQYSSGNSRVVTDRSASVMIHNVSPASVW